MTRAGARRAGCLTRRPALAFALLAAVGVGEREAGAQLPPSTLAVQVEGEWREWWRAEAAPARWTAPAPEVVGAVSWRRVADGVEQGTLLLRGTGEARQVRVVLVRLDPALVQLRTEANLQPDGSARGWTVADAPGESLVALNAGQFTREGPWGWVVHRGRELRPPGRGPLAGALVVDTAGALRLVAADSVPVLHAAGIAREAVQSYPMVLDRGEVPLPVRGLAPGVDVRHRDARLGIGLLPDGRVLVALTRFDALGGMFERLPFGLTTPEMAAVLGALGCTRAMLLDGGISGQLLVRAAPGADAERWPGLRDVPIGLVAIQGRSADMAGARHP